MITPEGGPGDRLPVLSKTMIAIPSYKGLTYLPFLDALHDTAVVLAGRKIPVELCVVVGHSYVQMARNDLVARFLESDCDKLVFLDEDVSWTPDAFLALLESDKPITAAVYPMKTNNVGSFPLPVVPVCTEDGVPLVDGPYIRAVRAMTGFMCIHKEVFPKIRESYPELTYAYRKGDSDVDGFDYFPQGVHDGTWYGEDFAFCRLWEKIGGEVSVMPDFTLGHHGAEKSWYGNLSEYISQLPGGVNHGNPDAEKAVWCEDAKGGLLWRY